jgi:hypothetical protein
MQFLYSLTGAASSSSGNTLHPPSDNDPNVSSRRAMDAEEMQMNGHTEDMESTTLTAEQESNQVVLRKKILEIQKDVSIPASEKASMIQVRFCRIQM